MKKLTILITANEFSSAVFAQTEDVKRDEIFSDGNTFAKIEKDGCYVLSPTCNFILYNLSKELF